MGKKQHQKDKLYLTCSEWSNIYGGKRKDNHGAKKDFRRLPFDHCALSLQPFEHPLCTPEGVVYDLMNIAPFLKKYGIDPASGKPLESSTLVKLNFVKNSDGIFHCPVLFKVFNENSHIVAIKTTGNVFSYEAIEELNIKTKNFKDLLNDLPFERKDIITIQDPENLEKFNFSNFHHLKKKLKVVNDEMEAGSSKNEFSHNLKSISSVTRDVLEELRKGKDSADVGEKEKIKVKADKFNAAHYSTGAVAASCTSTAVDTFTSQEAAILDDDVVRYARVKKKGYVRIETNLGLLNLELHCDLTPKACENFIKLSEKGYYDGTVFHRSIRNFMIQGGDPTGTGKGGESIWGKPFKDEFKPFLNHQGRGNLSMANSGPNTNKSQFFITFRSCLHLDKKHTLFGRVVGGLDTLNIMEQIEADEEDRPKEVIKILKIAVFVNPFQEVDDQLVKEREKESLKRSQMPSVTLQSGNKKTKTYHDGIGKYINIEARNQENSNLCTSVKKKKNINAGFGDFSCW